MSFLDRFILVMVILGGGLSFFILSIWFLLFVIRWYAKEFMNLVYAYSNTSVCTGNLLFRLCFA